MTREAAMAGARDSGMAELRGAFRVAIEIGDLFAAAAGWPAVTAVVGAERTAGEARSGVAAVVDRFAGGAACGFLRWSGPTCAVISSAGEYRVTTAAGGGWLLLPARPEGATYWIPQPPRRRRVDAVGRILEETTADLTRITASTGAVGIEVAVAEGWSLDLVVWRLPVAGEVGPAELASLTPVERQPLFLWGSHTTYARPADLYLHLLYGHVYENRASWPHYWKVCSENDAHALWVGLRGLQLATGKGLYGLLRRQLLLSLLARQATDGGWYHGEWTSLYESHFRLHTSGVHLLLDALSEGADPAVQAALARAVAFLAERAVKIDAGTWFLHDSLEESVESMRQSPFAWLESRALGKGESNMLVLNTHLDTAVALARYGELTGDLRYATRVESARQAAHHLLCLRPAEWLYQPLFAAIRLSFLPTPEAERLPAPVRAVKRIGWRYLIPWLVRVKRRYPRLVMPGGYIDRALSLTGLAHDYQSIHTMDLARYLCRLPDPELVPLLDQAIDFTFASGLVARWGELPSKRYALGFLAETLYHRAMADPAPGHRARLAQVMALLEEYALGQPPSLLGGNGEVVAPAQQVGPPAAVDGHLRVANLSRGERREVVVVNPTTVPIPLVWARGGDGLVWRDSTGAAAGAAVVPAGGWLWGQGG